MTIVQSSNVAGTRPAAASLSEPEPLQNTRPRRVSGILRALTMSVRIAGEKGVFGDGCWRSFRRWNYHADFMLI